MKPNDKAIEAAFAAAEAHIGNTSQREWLREILTAAYAAQFQSKDYAGLVKQLRFINEDTLNIEPYSCEQLCKSAADAIEALLAERDTYKNWLDNYEKQFAAKVEELVTIRLERDALAARLAPVDDEALVEIAARTIVKENVYKETQIPSKTLARAALAAIRPHIEADIADKFINPTPEMIAAAWAVFRRDNHKSIGPGPGFVEAMKAMAAAAIRSGK